MKMALEKIMSIFQEGTVMEYCGEFQTLLDQVKNSEDFTEDYGVYVFICGLKLEIGETLMRLHNIEKGLRMEEAMSMARLRERIVNSDSVQERYIAEWEVMVMILQERFQKGNRISSNQMISSGSEVSMFILEAKSDSSYQFESPYHSQFTNVESDHHMFYEMSQDFGSKMNAVMDDDSKKNKKDESNKSGNDNKYDLLCNATHKNDKHETGTLNQRMRVIIEVDDQEIIKKKYAHVFLLTSDSDQEEKDVNLIRECGFLTKKQKQFNWTDTGWQCSSYWKTRNAQQDYNEYVRNSIVVATLKTVGATSLGSNSLLIVEMVSYSDPNDFRYRKIAFVARKDGLFDIVTVANKKHTAVWHRWAIAILIGTRKLCCCYKETLSIGKKRSSSSNISYGSDDSLFLIRFLNMNHGIALKVVIKALEIVAIKAKKTWVKGFEWKPGLMCGWGETLSKVQHVAYSSDDTLASNPMKGPIYVAKNTCTITHVLNNLCTARNWFNRLKNIRSDELQLLNQGTSEGEMLLVPKILSSYLYIMDDLGHQIILKVDYKENQNGFHVQVLIAIVHLWDRWKFKQKWAKASPAYAYIFVGLDSKGHTYLTKKSEHQTICLYVCCFYCKFAIKVMSPRNLVLTSCIVGMMINYILELLETQTKMVQMRIQRRIPSKEKYMNYSYRYNQQTITTQPYTEPSAVKNCSLHEPKKLEKEKLNILVILVYGGTVACTLLLLINEFYNHGRKLRIHECRFHVMALLKDKLNEKMIRGLKEKSKPSASVELTLFDLGCRVNSSYKFEFWNAGFSTVGTS